MQIKKSYTISFKGASIVEIEYDSDAGLDEAELEDEALEVFNALKDSTVRNDIEEISFV
jgi:hypothetical protein